MDDFERKEKIFLRKLAIKEGIGCNRNKIEMRRESISKKKKERVQWSGRCKKDLNNQRKKNQYKSTKRKKRERGRVSKKLETVGGV